MRIVRTLIAMMLTVAVLVTWQGSAFARTQAPAEGQVVLCLGHGSVTVYIDTDGQPTSAPHLCNDCAQAFVAVLPGDSAFALREFGFDRVTVSDEATQVALYVLRTGSARGPPFDVI